MNFLIISDIVDIKTKKITHFSLDKGLNLGIGIKNNGYSVDYVVDSENYFEDGITYLNYKELTEEKINSYTYIIIVREAIIHDILEQFTELKKVFFNKNRNSKIIIKSDSSVWINNKDFRKYISINEKINASKNSICKWINNNIDIICVQNKELYELSLEQGVYKNKILISNMAVPNKIIDYDNLINPYLEDYSYCTNKNNLFAGLALYPLYYEKNPDKIEELKNKKRKKIIYIGRIKTDSGKIIYLIKDIINKLGDDYELHIFPGSFCIYNHENNLIEKYSANNSNHLEILRNKIFPESKNVFIHCPFNHSDIYRYLWYADIGIDFSSSRPFNIQSTAGNAKLLEYCMLGLPVVSESNVNNSWLVTNANNGILLNNIGNVDDYVNSIKQLDQIIINREKASKITIQNENWDIRAKNMINDLQKMFKV
jgi:hypothetical protein